MNSNLSPEMKETIKKNAAELFLFLTEQFEKEEFVEFMALSFTKDGQVMAHTISFGQTPLMSIVGALECQKMTVHAQIARHQAMYENEIAQQVMNVDIGNVFKGH